MTKRLQKIQTDLLCQSLSVPAWITDRNGVVIENNPCRCPIPVGKSIFRKGITVYERTGLFLWDAGKPTALRFYFRNTGSDMLCIAYRHLQTLPEPFGARQERLTCLLDDLTAMLSSLCEHPDDACMEWLRIWRHPSALASVRHITDRLPESISAHMSAVVLSQCFAFLGKQYHVKDAFPDDLKIPSADSLSLFIRIYAVILLLRQTNQAVENAELYLTAENDWIGGHLRIALSGCDEEQFSEYLRALESESREADDGFRMIYCVSEGTAMIHFHNALPPQSLRVKWRWRNAEDSAIRQWMDALLLIADGIESLDLQAAASFLKKNAPKASVL